MGGNAATLITISNILSPGQEHVSEYSHPVHPTTSSDRPKNGWVVSSSIQAPVFLGVSAPCAHRRHRERRAQRRKGCPVKYSESSHNHLNKSPSQRIQALLQSGIFKARQCESCGRKHLALRFAPADAPCGRCVSNQPALDELRLRKRQGSRRYSPHYLAYLEQQSVGLS